MFHLLALTISLTNGPFEDQASPRNLHFQHLTGWPGEYHFPEITGAGAALADFDNDGDLDIWLVQSGDTSDASKNADQVFFQQDGEFENQSTRIAPSSNGYGMGVAVGDINGDNFNDVLVTNVGANRLYLNDGSRFVASDVAWSKDDWSTSAAFLDADKDGDLDLYVANYVRFDMDRNPSCLAASGRRDYCGPSGFPGQSDRYYRNDDGTLVEATGEFFPEMREAAGLGVAVADYNGDGYPDIYVANDGAANFLWLNQQGRSFVDDALFAGAAMNGSGLPEASMGIAQADIDDDGDVDLFLSHLMEETNTLYRNNGRGGFSDITAARGLAAPSLGYTGWGTGFTDIDFDGDLDLLIFNGAVRTIESQRAAGAPYPFLESNQAFIQESSGKFREVSEFQGDDFLRELSSRGAAFGDIDNDGDEDVLVNNGNGPAQLLINTNQSDRAGRRWLGLSLSPRARSEGAKIRVQNGNISQTRIAETSGSYASASDPRVRFWLSDESEAAPTIRIDWPNGSSSEHQLEANNQYHEVNHPDASSP